MTGVALGVVVLLLRPHRRLLLVHRPHSRGVSRVEPRVGQTAGSALEPEPQVSTAVYESGVWAGRFRKFSGTPQGVIVVARRA